MRETSVTSKLFWGWISIIIWNRSQAYWKIPICLLGWTKGVLFQALGILIYIQRGLSLASNSLNFPFLSALCRVVHYRISESCMKSNSGHCRPSNGKTPSKCQNRMTAGAISEVIWCEFSMADGKLVNGGSREWPQIWEWLNSGNSVSTDVDTCTSFVVKIRFNRLLLLAGSSKCLVHPPVAKLERNCER